MPLEEPTLQELVYYQLGLDEYIYSTSIVGEIYPGFDVNTNPRFFSVPNYRVNLALLLYAIGGRLDARFMEMEFRNRSFGDSEHLDEFIAMHALQGWDGEVSPLPWHIPSVEFAGHVLKYDGTLEANEWDGWNSACKKGLSRILSWDTEGNPIYKKGLVFVRTPSDRPGFNDSFERFHRRFQQELAMLCGWNHISYPFIDLRKVKND